jgi:hypothetical protein
LVWVINGPSSDNEDQYDLKGFSELITTEHYLKIVNRAKKLRIPIRNERCGVGSGHFLYAIGPTTDLANATLYPAKEVSQAKESASTHMAKTTAIEMATEAQITPKAVPANYCMMRTLTGTGLNDRWTVEVGSEEHRAMERVLREIKN